MAWKLATGFVFTVGVSRRERMAVIWRIRRTPGELVSCGFPCDTWPANFASENNESTRPHRRLAA
jgi:hypothetical protein